MITGKAVAEHMQWGRSLEKVLGPLCPCETFNWHNAAITSVTDDSRRVRRGSLFVAVRGEDVDGHDYIDDALERGAAAVLCEKLPPGKTPSVPLIRVRNSRFALSLAAARFFGTAENLLKPIGVTGTDGKTTTTYLLHAMLKEAGFRPGLIGTLKNDLGFETREAVQTTPHPVALHSMLRDMNRHDLSHAVMEVSSHALVHRRVRHVPFDMAVLTNVTEDHLDFHRTIEAYIRAKRMLFRQLSEDAVAILNVDCPVWERYAQATRASVLTYGINGIADIKLLERNQGIDGTVMKVRTPLETFDLKTPLVGDFNCENVLAAVAAGFAAGIPGADLKTALENFEGVPGRLEKVKGGEGEDLPTFFVDYAHTPDSLGKILATLRPLTKGQLICVFGCGGERERQKRPKMGNIATSGADVSVITSDNSRGEKTENIIGDITDGINKSGGRYLIEPDRRLAIAKALDVSNSSQDVVVVCGKGAESYQEIGNKKIAFDDREVCREVMDNVVPKKRKTA